MEPCKILIVDNEMSFAKNMQESLQRYGYEVPLIEPSGEAAIELVNKIHPDLILIDVALRGKVNGFQTAKTITIHHDIPIIFLTPQKDVETFQRTNLNVPYSYLVKPFDSRTLYNTIELALFKHQVESKLAVETNRLKSLFLSNMSHELLTPLNGIIGFTELLYNDKSSKFNNEKKNYLLDILSNSHHLLELIHNILDLAALESGALKFHPVLINLQQIIEDLKEPLIPFIAKKQIKLNITISPNLRKIIIDPAKLKTVLYHYLSNAIKFSRRGSTILIDAVEEPNNQFRVKVTDHGIGIKNEKIPDLFMPFQQLDLSTSKKYQGAGLGLALTRLIVEAQGGQVGVETEFGKGSIFHVVLPRTPISTN